MKLGTVFREGVNSIYRIALPMLAMRELGHEVVDYVQQPGERVPVEQLLDCDLVQMHRLVLFDDEDDTIERLLAAGVAVGIDDDDDHHAITPEMEALLGSDCVARGQRNHARVLERIGRVSLVTTPSDALANMFLDAGAENVHVIENRLPGAFNRVNARGHEGFVVGWHACGEHLTDADALGLRETLTDLLESHPDVHVVTVCVDLELDHERYHHEESIAFDRLTQRLADFDLGIAPLADIPFNRARSNVKAREFAAAGVPWLASPTGEYLKLGSAEGGHLIADDRWGEALDHHVRARFERGRLRRRAKSWAKGDTIGEWAHLWEEAFYDAVEVERAAV